MALARWPGLAGQECQAARPRRGAHTQLRSGFGACAAGARLTLDAGDQGDPQDMELAVSASRVLEQAAARNGTHAEDVGDRTPGGLRPRLL